MVTGIFSFIFICFAIFSITPQGKAANASYRNQEARAAQIAAQKKQHEEARDAKRQAQEDKDEARKKVLEAREQAKQDAEQAKQDAARKVQEAANEIQQAKDEQSSTTSKMNAYSMAQQFVSDSLKSPGSAKYPGYDEQYVQLTGDNTYSVSAYVDSQNSFGALLRGYWTTTVTNEGNGHWKGGEVTFTRQTD